MSKLYLLRRIIMGKVTLCVCVSWEEGGQRGRGLKIIGHIWPGLFSTTERATPLLSSLDILSLGYPQTNENLIMPGRVVFPSARNEFERLPGI